jgi:hypothetical protein
MTAQGNALGFAVPKWKFALKRLGMQMRLIHDDPISPLQGDRPVEGTRPRGPTYRSVPALGCPILAFQAGR